jgi:chromosome segregation protein
MYLMEINLENFKSFGRKISIPFKEGFTAITGPNGSGKSNIADAILFVLGPKSSKAIRAGKLTDLIFNGAKSKRPAKSCRVSLVFDNSDRVLPIDTDKVTLTRAVKHSPSKKDAYYSYFYVNGKASSLNEFDNLLAHARITADGYNFVQQGDINRIVGMSNLERRRILDDIAGITRYDKDIQRAEKQREEAEANLEKIGILLDEIKRNIRDLARDRDNAITYREMQGTLQLAKAQMASKKREEIEDQLRGVSTQIAEYDGERGSFREAIAERKARLTDLEKELDDVEKEIFRVGGADAEQLKGEIDRVRLERFKAEDREEKAKDLIGDLKMAKAAQQQELRGIRKQLAVYKKQLDDYDNDIGVHKKHIADLQAQQEEANAQARNSSKDIETLQREVAQTRKEHDELLEDQHALALERDRAKDRAERNAMELAQMEERIKTLEFELKDLDFSTSDISKSSGAKRGRIKELQDRIFKDKAAEKKLMKEAGELEMAVKRLSRDFSALKAESEAAVQLEKGYTRAVNAVIDARDRGILRGVLGTIAELAEVDKKYEDALTVAAGMRMQSVVVEDDEAAAQCIGYLKKTKIGRATFLPLNKMRKGRPGGKALMAVRNDDAVGFARDLVKYDERYEAAFWYAFGDTVVVKNLAVARKLMGGVRLVTVDGELTEASGAMIGGAIARSMIRFGAPAKTEFDRVRKELRMAVDRSDVVGAELVSLRDSTYSAESELREIAAEEGTDSSKLEDIDTRRKEYKVRLKGLRKERNKLKTALDTSQKEAGNRESDLSSMESKLAELEARRDEFTNKVNKATPKDLSARIAHLGEEIHESREDLRDVESKMETVQTQNGLLQKHETDVVGKIDEIDQDTKEAKATITEAKETARAMDVELNGLLKVEEQTSTEVERLRIRKEKAFEEKTKLLGEVDGLETKLETHADLMIQLKVKTQALETTLKEAEEECARYEVQIKQPLPPLETLNATVRDTEVKMARLEPVNMRAISEYDVQVQRRDELQEELKQLEKQKKDLIKLVDELNKKKKYGLYKVFDAIDRNFQEIFAVLSNGGDAHLQLENPDEPFEGGLIIEARPPNKKVLRLESLSGGEKSLTALALIFAIQRFDPSPFYLLDEVDMFLDAVNAEAVARTVAHSSSYAQVLMISLRKVTLTKADQLYGVTLMPTGVSDVVGKVNLADFKEELPAHEEAKVMADGGVPDGEDCEDDMWLSFRDEDEDDGEGCDPGGAVHG